MPTSGFINFEDRENFSMSGPAELTTRLPKKNYSFGAADKTAGDTPLDALQTSCKSGDQSALYGGADEGMLVDYSWTTRPSFLDAPLLLLLPPSLECHEEAQHAPFGLPLADGLQPPFDYGATGDQRTLIVNLTDQTLASVNGTSQPLLDTNLGLGFTYEDALGQYDPSFDFTAFSNQDLLTTNDIQWPSINKLSVFYDSSLSLFTNFVNDHQLQQTPAMLEQSYAPQEPVFDSEVVPQGNIGPSCDTPSRMIIPRISQPLSDTAIHQPGERISCTHPGCTTIFRRAGDYRRHMKKHRPYDFECSFPGCSKRFWRGDKMRDHAKVHTKGRQGA